MHIKNLLSRVSTTAVHLTLVNQKSIYWISSAYEFYNTDAVNRTAKIRDIETVLITVPNGNGITNPTLKYSLCVPEIKYNLLSTAKVKQIIVQCF